MALKLHQHPLSSFCQKVIIALYETGTPFEAVHLDLGDEGESSKFLALWPIGKMPVLEDGGHVVPETSIIIEHLDLTHPGKARMIPADPDLALRTRLLDRIFDLHVQQPMQAIVADRLRPDERKDAVAVQEARGQLHKAYGVLERELAGPWAVGEAFTMADCAAAPALFYAGALEPFADYPRLSAYYDRLRVHPSVARTFSEARPFHGFFPGAELLNVA